MSLHRFCLDISHIALETDNPIHGSGTFITNEKPSFHGALAHLQELLSDIIFGRKIHTNFNFSIIKSDTFDTSQSDPNNGLTGCLLSLFRNQSDVYIRPTPYPVGEESIDFLSVFGQTSLEILTGYSSSDSGFDGDVTESVTSFSIINWFMIFLVLLVLFSGLKFSYKLSRKERETGIET